jgi:O-antigen ligase
MAAILAVAATATPLAAAKPAYGIGAVVAVVLVAAIVARPAALVLVLVFTLFVESVHVAPGLTADRTAGALAIAVVAAWLFVKGLCGLSFNTLLASVAAYGVWNLLSYYWSAHPGAALRIFVSYLLSVAYMLAVAVLVRKVGDIQAAFRTMAFGAFVFGLIAFVSFKSGAYRAAGLQGDPNFFAVFQAASLPPALALAANERRPPVRAAYYAVMVVIVLSVVASLSRTGLLALVGVVLASMFLPWRFYRSKSRKAAWVVAVLLLVPATAAVGSTTFVQRVDSIFHPNSAASDRGSGRTDIWSAALHGYRNHPWLGLGAGNFEVESLDLLQTTPGVNTATYYAQSSKVVHNAYLETLTELGPVGLAIFLSMLALTARTALRAYRRARDLGNRALERYALALLVSFAAVLVGGTFLSDQLSKITWILIGLSLALEVLTRPAAEPLPERRRAGPPPARAATDRPATTIARLERLVEARAATHPDQLEELRRKLRLVREHADAGGSLPPSLDDLFGLPAET